MRLRVAIGVLALAVCTGPLAGQAQSRLNPMIPLIEQGLPVLGVVHPSYTAGRAAGPGGGAPAQPVMAEIARETVAYRLGDFVLNSYSPATAEQYRAFTQAIVAAGGSARTHPFLAKIPIIHRDPAVATQRLIDQLNDGQVAVSMQEVETVEEVQQALAAMRFVSRGGTRPESGFERAAAYWGLTPAQYLEKADVWPVNPNGELLLTVIIESRAGVANARAIAALPSVSVVTVGAGTLGGVFTSVDADGQRVRDQAGFDAAVAQVLAACKEFRKACGYPANDPAEVTALMNDGWDFLIMQRRDQAAFDAVETGRRLGGRSLAPGR
jgi:4-hydroxy-2-oxoheptanedioate aldolase